MNTEFNLKKIWQRMAEWKMRESGDIYQSLTVHATSEELSQLKNDQLAHENK